MRIASSRKNLLAGVWITLATSILATGWSAAPAHAQSTYSELVESYNPVSYWRLGDSGSSAVDLMGTRDGQYQNGVSLGQSGAIFNDADTAARFDGSNDYVEIAHSSQYLIDNGALAFWFQYDGGGGATRQGIISKDAYDYVTGGHLTVFLENQNQIAVRLQSTSGTRWVYSSANIGAGNWFHIVFSWGSQGMKLYENGSLVDQDGYTGGLGSSSGGVGNQEPIAIGASTWTSGTGTVDPLVYYFHGAVDEVAIFSQQLNADAARDLYEGVPTLGTTYYVRKTGSDSNNGTTPATAFATVSKAASVLRGGDTVYVGAGSYVGDFEVKDAPQESSVLRFIADTTGAQTGDAGDVVFTGAKIVVDGSDNVQFDGFKLEGSNTHLEWKGGSTGGQLTNCVSDAAGSHGIKVSENASLRVSNCEVRDAVGDGIRIDRANSFTLEDSTVDGCGDEGLDIRDTPQVVVENCVFTNNVDEGIRSDTDSSSDTLDVRRCRVSENGGSGFYILDRTTITAENCLIVGNQERGIYTESGDPDVTVNHCTIADNDWDGIKHTEGDISVTNSIFAYNGDDGLDHDGDTFDHDYNLVYGNADDNYRNLSQSSHEIVANPNFLASDDYHLQSGSPAANEGTGSMAFDLDGYARPYGSAVDIGCYEEGAGLPGIYYVRISGDDSNHGRSPDQAFRTISKASTAVRAGDEVYVGAGTYYETVVVDEKGTSQDPIQFFADTSGAATGDAGSVVVVPSGNGLPAWDLQQSDYIVLDGFHIDGQGLSAVNGVNIDTAKGVTLKDCEIERAQDGVQSVASGLYVSGCQIHDNSRYSVYSNQGALFVQDTTVSDNTQGPYSFEDALFVADNADFTNNDSYGVSLIRPASLMGASSAATAYGMPSSMVTLADGDHATFEQCSIENNLDGPFLSGYSDFDDVEFPNTTNQNHQRWAIVLKDCVLDFSSSTWTRWPLGPNGGGIYGEDSELTFSGLTIEGYADNYAVFAKGGTLDVNSCQFRNSMYGLGTQFCTSFAATGSQFRQNTSWGLTIQGAGSLSSCSIESNGDGLYLQDTDDQQIDVLNVSIASNERYGVYAQSCQLQWSLSDQDDWQVTGNGYGIYGYNSDLTLQSFNVSGNTTYGVVGQEGTLSVSGGTFTNNGGGLFSDRNTAFTAQNCQFTANTQWGIRVAGKGTLTDCSISDNAVGGLYLFESSNNDIQLITTDITDNGEYGLYAESCQLTFDPTTVVQWQISGHDYPIFGHQSDLVFDRFTISGGNLYGVAAELGTLAIIDSTITGNTNGVLSNQNTSFTATGSQFTANSGWGIHAFGKVSLENCTVDNNTSGILIEQSTDDDLSMTNTALQDNQDYGVYVQSSSLTFSPTTMATVTVSGSKYAYVGNQSTLTLDNFTVSGGTVHGLASYDGNLDADDCTFSGNGIGLYAMNNQSCSVANSTFENNLEWGIHVEGKASFQTCSIENNTSGLSLKSTTNADVQATDLQIANNTNYGVYADSCNLTFDASMQNDWQVGDNGCCFGGYRSDLAFDGFAVSGGTTYGLYSTEGNVSLNNAEFTGNATGLFSQNDVSLAAVGTQFTGNTWGAAIDGASSFSNCTFTNNTDGLRLYNISNADWSGANCSITDNTGYGLYFETCNIVLDQSTNSAWNIARNGYGVVAKSSQFELDQYVVSENTTCGVMAESSDVVIQDSTITENATGLLSDNNNSLAVSGTEFTDNTEWAATVHGKGSFSDCTIQQNGHGIQLKDSVAGDFSLATTDITDNTGYGLYAEDSTLTLDTQLADGWTIARNKYGLGCLRSDVTLDQATIEDSTEYGVMASYSTMTVRNSQITSQLHGVYGDHNNSFMIVRSCCEGSGSGWAVENYDGNINVYNSVLAGHQDGVYHKSADGSDVAVLYNSTIANSTNDGVYVDKGMATVVNTIISGSNGRYGLAQVNGGQIDHSYNLIHGFSTTFQGTTEHDTEVLNNPRFVDAAQGDFHLAVGSPAINSGVDVSSVLTNDLEGNPRPAYNVFEIGAYEYVDANGSFRILTWNEKR